MTRLVVLSLCAGVVLLSSLAGSSAEDVIVLTPENFDLEVGQSKGALVEFYAPWCDYSKKLAPEYEKLGTTFKKTKNVLIGKVDCHQYISLCSKYRIVGYPTIKWFPPGSQDSKDYFGDRTVDALAEFVNTEAGIHAKLSTPASDVVELTPANFDSVVLDKTKDVLVYEEVVTALKKESAVVVAECDAAGHRELRERYLCKGIFYHQVLPQGQEGSSGV